MACLFYDFIPDETDVCALSFFMCEASLTLFTGGKCKNAWLIYLSNLERKFTIENINYLCVTKHADLCFQNL